MSEKAKYFKKLKSHQHQKSQLIVLNEPNIYDLQKQLKTAGRQTYGRKTDQSECFMNIHTITYRRAENISAAFSCSAATVKTFNLFL